MKVNYNVTFQIIFFILQWVNANASLFNPTAKLWTLSILLLIQGIVAILAHYYNPDGTSCKAAYEPKVK